MRCFLAMYWSGLECITHLVEWKQLPLSWIWRKKSYTSGIYHSNVLAVGLLGFCPRKTRINFCLPEGIFSLSLSLHNIHMHTSKYTLPLLLPPYWRNQCLTQLLVRKSHPHRQMHQVPCCQALSFVLNTLSEAKTDHTLSSLGRRWCSRCLQAIQGPHGNTEQKDLCIEATPGVRFELVSASCRRNGHPWCGRRSVQHWVVCHQKAGNSCSRKEPYLLEWQIVQEIKTVLFCQGKKQTNFWVIVLLYCEG